MKNAETPVVKVVLYGAMSSLGSALMAEMLRRQHEVIAILDNLTALAPRPGLRTKTGDLFEAERVKQSVAGSSAVICLLDAPGLPFNSEHVEKTIVPGPVEQVLAVDALIDGMQAAAITDLFAGGRFRSAGRSGTDDPLQRHAAEEIREALQSSALHWTLVNAPRGVPGLTIEHFSQVSGSLEPGLAEPLERLNRTAVGIADELRLNLHVGEHVNFIAASKNAPMRSCATLRSFDFKPQSKATPDHLAIAHCWLAQPSTNQQTAESTPPAVYAEAEPRNSRAGTSPFVQSADTTTLAPASYPQGAANRWPRPDRQSPPESAKCNCRNATARAPGRSDAQFAKNTAPVEPVTAVLAAQVQQRKLQQRLGGQGQGDARSTIAGCTPETLLR
jgi:hypothetical protein